MFDRSLWATTFTALPSWPCPSCNGGRLVIVAGCLKEEETVSSRSSYSHEAWDISWVERRFSAHMTCSDPSCGEGAVVIGTSRSDETYDYDYDGTTVVESYNIFHPTLIHPSPMIISVPEETPDDVRDEIKRASALVWVDVASSANKLRLAAERILTALKVPKTQLAKGRRRPIMLAQRISNVSNKMPEIAELLHSIRFIGNVASHESLEGVDRNDLLSAFEIIEHVAELAFSNKKKRILKAAKDIKRRKGKPPAKKRDEFSF